ncbi:hydroxyethylthiazole kinase [Microbacterium paludicola]|uniref:Hydroxyethylthiazole kinase n=1 Tax=Microbacterium paludicola TaxID=300019 RepID=A0A4Y9FW45_9MICO|nr:hydroxyethylthiazole kinase [Microbacterium paludicola]MBF0815709.1 hydroxyethylthiazole kinase [Microbacterium paludicola]TFU33550.1 hydroxyethylthiazole kinase [Microbacterium paludicola]
MNRARLLEDQGLDHEAHIDAGEILARLREAVPLVQCITNSVVVNFTANVLLAAGASPVMADVPGEAGECARFASALLVNLGTPTSEQRQAMIEAVEAARDAGTPWVLDPVGVGALSLRTTFARELLAHRPAAIRGNASEILALAGEGAGGRGVDAADDVEHTRDVAVRLARETGAVVAVSGPVDLITDGEWTVRVPGGSALLTRVTGGGCSLGATAAACVAAALAEGRPALHGAVAAHALHAAASETAAAEWGGPGGFAVAFLDALAAIEPAALSARELRLEPIGGAAAAAR